MAPLLVASTAGWAALIARMSERRSSPAVLALTAALAFGIVLVSQAESYQVLRQLPGGWRLQYAREWLSPPAYERLSYPVNELNDISQFLYRRSIHTVLVPDHGKLEENLRVISYLAPNSPPVAAPSVETVPVIQCGTRTFRPAVDHVAYCLEPPAGESAESAGTTVEVLFLRPRSGVREYGVSPDETVIYYTNSLELVRRSLSHKSTVASS
jgi:hypothetical protein